MARMGFPKVAGVHRAGDLRCGALRTVYFVSAEQWWHLQGTWKWVKIPLEVPSRAIQSHPTTHRLGGSLFPQSYHVKSRVVTVFRFIYDVNAYMMWTHILNQFCQTWNHFCTTLNRVLRPFCGSYMTQTHIWGAIWINFSKTWISFASRWITCCRPFCGSYPTQTHIWGIIQTESRLSRHLTQRHTKSYGPGNSFPPQCILHTT